MKSDRSVVRFESVSRFYEQGGQVVRALDGVDLTLSEGEFAAVAGPSGSGKTTLLNVCSGLDLPTQGRVWVGHRELSGLSRKERSELRLRHIGFVFQTHNLIPVLSVEENAEFILLLRGMPEEERKGRVRNVLTDISHISP